jgi:nucleoside-diphosphate-sugar epimerase
LYGVPIVNARFFNVFGPGEVPGKYRNVIPNFMFWAMNKQTLPITGDGTETRDWTFVGDICNGLLAMGIEEKAIGQAFNLGSGKEHQVIEMANLVNIITGNKSGTKLTLRRDWDVKTRLLSSIDKAQKILGYQPEMQFEDGIKELFNWFIQNSDNISKSAEF